MATIKTIRFQGQDAQGKAYAFSFKASCLAFPDKDGKLQAAIQNGFASLGEFPESMQSYISFYDRSAMAVELHIGKGMDFKRIRIMGFFYREA